MSNLFLSMLLIFLFKFYELNILTNVSLHIPSHTLIMVFLFITKLFEYGLYAFFIDSLFFRKTPSFPYLKPLDSKCSPQIIQQIVLIFFMALVLQYTGKIAPAGKFYTNELTIFNNTTLCDYFSIPKCTKNATSITVYGEIAIQYLSYNEKLISINYVNGKTNQKERIHLRLINPEMTWLVDSCYTSRYFMNAVSPYFR